MNSLQILVKACNSLKRGYQNMKDRIKEGADTSLQTMMWRESVINMLRGYYDFHEHQKMLSIILKFKSMFNQMSTTLNNKFNVM